MAKKSISGGKALARRLLGRAYRELGRLPERAHSWRSPTFVSAAMAFGPSSHGQLRMASGLLNAGRWTGSPAIVVHVRRQASDALAHRFDLLGSGPVVVRHGMRCQGIEGNDYAMSRPVEPDRAGRWLTGRVNRANLAEARRIWGLVDEDYVPIDWQLDFKSGFRWSEACWYRDIRFARDPGVDVKVPWELARCQHLPVLAVAGHFASLALPGFEAREVYWREFRNETLDFLACNPPGFGVNWACAMDVAIRAVNLLIARDIALASGARFDDAFESIFAASMLAHGRHVVANLEWSPQYRGNHYLANLAGLLFVAAYLPDGDEVDAWLAFAVQELLSEVAYQFHEDGSNFEASVCYHRLSAEIVLWAFALLAGLRPEKQAVLQRAHRHRSLPRLRAQVCAMHPLPWGTRESPIPGWCWERLARMAAFTRSLTRPDGLVVQFGDNDSGRFVSLGSGEQLRASNDPDDRRWSLDHGALTAGIDALLGIAAPPADELGVHLLCALARVPELRPASRASAMPYHSLPSTSGVADERTWREASARRDGTPAPSRRTTRFGTRANGPAAGLRADVQCNAFPGMGCYVLRGPRFYLAIRCGEIGLAGLGAHAHCDQLGIELVIDGETLVSDPGTYIYTALPARRNAYRSARVHHVPRVSGREPADLQRGCFDLRGAAEGQCLYFGAAGFVGCHSGYGPRVYRQIVIGDDGIDVHDFAEGGLAIADPRPDPIPFSPGYGRLVCNMGVVR